MRRLCRSTRMPILLGAVVACGGGGERQPADPIATWHIDTLPFLDIGGEAGDTMPPIGRAVGVAAVSDTTYVVADRAHHQLHYFNHVAQRVGSAGRQGDGPGEFRFIQGISRCGDSLHILDIDHLRWAVTALDGVPVRSYPVVAPTGVAERVPYAWACNGDGNFIRMEYPLPAAEQPSRVRPQVRIWLSNSSGGVSAELGSFPGPELLVHRLTMRPFPLGKRSLIAIGADRAYVGLADSSTILTYRLDGTLISSINTPYHPRGTTEGDREAFRLLDTLGKDSTGVHAALRRWGTFDFPPAVPAYTALVVDGTDLLWVRAFPQPLAASVRWAALTKNGILVGTVDLPTVLEVFEIGVDHVLGIETSSADGSQRVRGYRLRR